MGIAERREREIQVRRENAVKAAMLIYHEEGYHAATMEKIAERADLSRAALYTYFKNKDEMFVSAIVAHFYYFADLLQDIYDRRKKIGNRLLKELWEVFNKFHDKDPIAFNAALYLYQNEAIRNLPNSLREIIHGSGSQAVKLQHKIMEYGVRKGIFIECDHRTLSEVIWSTFLGIMQLETSKRVLSKKNHLDISQELAINVLERGILKTGYSCDGGN